MAMLDQEPQLAPLAERARYFAVFQRFFAAVVNYTQRDERSGILLGGWLAETLHDVPVALWRYTPDVWHQSDNMNHWIEEFPDFLRKCAAPQRLIENSRVILSATGAAQELGLKADLSDFDPAPLPQFKDCLYLLHNACLSMRLMINYGGRPSFLQRSQDRANALYDTLFASSYRGRSYTPWKGLEATWNERAQAQAEHNGRLAALFLPLPAGLAYWSAFDEVRFRNAVRSFEGPFRLPPD